MVGGLFFVVLARRRSSSFFSASWWFQLLDILPSRLNAAGSHHCPGLGQSLQSFMRSEQLSQPGYWSR